MVFREEPPYELTAEDKCPCICKCYRRSLEGLCSYCTVMDGAWNEAEEETHGYD